MISYELAKELKDAGFPQKDHVGPGVGTYLELDKWDGELGYGKVYVPTLSELIEACGDNFASLRRTTFGNWIAFSAGNPKWALSGTTTEEAVTRLWLALNAK